MADVGMPAGVLSREEISKMAAMLRSDSSQRDRLANDIAAHLTRHGSDPMQQLQALLQLGGTRAGPEQIPTMPRA